jgi:hypothetical protein
LHRDVISALSRLRQEDCGFGASLVYPVCFKQTHEKAPEIYDTCNYRVLLFSSRSFIFVLFSFRIYNLAADNFTLSGKYPTQRASAVAQVVKHLFSNPEFKGQYPPKRKKTNQSHYSPVSASPVLEL